MPDITRRNLVAATAASLIGTRGWAGANDRIRIAILGLGGRGGDHLKLAAQVPGVEVATFCDPDVTQLQKRGAQFEKLTGKKPAFEQDLRRVMDDKSIDAVTIATCNHWHALAAIWACQAGKHVYVEKPVCHDMFEGRQMIAASQKYNRLMQGGTQRRSNGYFRAAVQALREGVIGDVYMARCIHYQLRESLGFKTPEPPPSTLNWDVWVGPGPMQPFHRNLVHYNWHWFWDFGNGELANNGIHYIDVARWGLNRGLPSRIHSTGGRFGYKDQAQTPNTLVTTCEYPDGAQLVVEIRGRYSNTEDGMRSGVIFYGSKGYMNARLTDDRVEIFLGGSQKAEPPLRKLEDVDRYGEDELSHFHNFFDAIRANKRDLLTAEINETYTSTAITLLGNISYRLKRELRFDPAQQRFTGDEDANSMMTGTYRAPFTVPDKV
jgi:predicted dehydrogenase